MNIMDEKTGISRKVWKLTKETQVEIFRLKKYIWSQKFIGGGLQVDWVGQKKGSMNLEIDQ